jgi:hypothetical protein
VYAGIYHRCGEPYRRGGPEGAVVEDVTAAGVAAAVVQNTGIRPPPGAFNDSSLENAAQRVREATRPDRVAGGKASSAAKKKSNTERDQEIYDAHHKTGKTARQIGVALQLSGVRLSDSQIRRIISKPRP